MPGEEESMEDQIALLLLPVLKMLLSQPNETFIQSLAGAGAEASKKKQTPF
jgi:hypothetical protein